MTNSNPGRFTPSPTPTREVVASLARAPEILVAMVGHADPAVLRRRPASGKWSIHEHICHVAAIHPLFERRLDLMLGELNPAIKSYDPGRDDPDDALLTVDLDQAISRFERERRRLVQRLERLRPEDWARTARHEEYNSYSVPTMFRHLALHDCFHAYRIEELLLRKDWPAPSEDPGR